MSSSGYVLPVNGRCFLGILCIAFLLASGKIPLLISYFEQHKTFEKTNEYQDLLQLSVIST
jgi:hypothetical protein